MRENAKLRTVFCTIFIVLFGSCNSITSNKNTDNKKSDQNIKKVIQANRNDVSHNYKITKKTNSFKIENMTFKVNWDDSLSYSDNIGYYGGIKTLDVYKDEKHLQTLKHIEDKIALGYIIFRFEDFNLDGWLDFRIPLNEKYPMYYLFNPETKAYQRAEDWDYLRDYKLDKEKMQITTNAYDFSEVTTYKIQDLKLIEIK